MTKRRDYLEAQLGPKKIEAAILLVQLQQGSDAEDAPKQMSEIAERVGVSNKTVWEWRKTMEFTEYLNILTDFVLVQQRGVVNKRLMQLIDTKQPSVKAIELYMKRFGLLTERHETVTNEVKRYETNEELQESLEKLEQMKLDRIKEAEKLIEGFEEGVE